MTSRNTNLVCIDERSLPSLIITGKHRVQDNDTTKTGASHRRTPTTPRSKIERQFISKVRTDNQVIRKSHSHIDSGKCEVRVLEKEQQRKQDKRYSGLAPVRLFQRVLPLPQYNSPVADRSFENGRFPRSDTIAMPRYSTTRTADATTKEEGVTKWPK